jgi:hypothetical protein
VCINFKTVSCLVNTGAVASCMSETFEKTLKLTPSPALQELQLISANQSPIHSLGVVEVGMSIQGLVIPFCFYVIRSLSYNVVLGYDFLKSSGACINCAEHRISLFDGLVQTSLTRQSDKSVVLKLAQDITIPPATEAIVKLAVPKRFQHRLGISETYAPIKNRFLLVAGTLIHPEGDTTLCKILNTGLKPQRLRVKTPIAQIGQIDLTHPFNRALLCVDLPDNLQDENNVKVHSLPSHEERVRILESKGITLDNPNLTLDQFSDLTALLFEYQDLFCSD